MLGITENARSALPLAFTSHTLRSASAYTTRSPLPEAAGTASGSFDGCFGPPLGETEGTAIPGFVGFADTSAGALAEAWYARTPTATTAAAVSPATNPELLLATVPTSRTNVSKGDGSSRCPRGPGAVPVGARPRLPGRRPSQEP
ncbi:hypothetical protein SNARM312S_07511 [Streptomyces narbonensis]